MTNTTRETAVISGKAFWTKLNRKDEYSEKYQMDIGELSEKSKDLLSSHGVNLKNKEDDRGEYVTARSRYVVPIIDSDKRPVDQETLIGNGSEVKAKVAFNKTHGFVDQNGTSLYLNKVQVVNLIEFRQDTDFDDDDDELA